MVPQLPFDDLWTANDAAQAWCIEVNAVRHSEICAVPAQRLERERELLRPLPELRPAFGLQVVSRKVDKLSCIRFGSARYSVSAYYLICRLEYGLTCRSRRGDHGLGSPPGESVFEPVAGAVDGQHVGVVEETVKDGGGEDVVAEDAPIR
jgi:hypothetical protein